MLFIGREQKSWAVLNRHPVRAESRCNITTTILGMGKRPRQKLIVVGGGWK